MNRLKLLSSSVLFKTHLSGQPAVPESRSQLEPSAAQQASSYVSPCPVPVRHVLPKSYVDSYAYPLIVWFHSHGNNENEIRTVAEHISLQNYAYLGLRGTMLEDRQQMTFGWSSSAASISRCEDSLWRAIDDMSSRYNLHKRRIFLAGYGAGATMAREIAYRRSNQFAGCIALGGRIPRGRASFADMSSLSRLRQYWAVAIGNPELSVCDFESDIDLAAMARMKLDVYRYTTDDEMVTEVLGDVNRWIMDIIQGKCDSKRWDSHPTRYSAN